MDFGVAWPHAAPIADELQDAINGIGAEGCWDKNCVQQQQRTVRSSSTCEFNVKSCRASGVPSHHAS